MSDICACGHEHTTGRIGTCSKFLCPCPEWRAPDPARVTSLPWRVGKHGGCIVADDLTPDESPLGRADASAIGFYGGVLVGESMRTADAEYAVRAANQYEALKAAAEALRELCATDPSHGRKQSPNWAHGRAHVAADEALARVDAIRSGS